MSPRASLVEAICLGDEEAVLELLLELPVEAGGEVNSLDAEGRTPLMYAAAAGRVDFVEALLEVGADPSIQDRLDETALLKAAAAGHTNVYTRLLRYAKAEEKAFAATLLAAAPHGPLPPGPREDSLESSSPWPDRLARAGAYAADLLGDSAPQSRLARVLRSRKLKR